MANFFYDKNQVRYELVDSYEGYPYNWLFLPGGPGANSSYLPPILKLYSARGFTSAKCTVTDSAKNRARSAANHTSLYTLTKVDKYGYMDCIANAAAEIDTR